MIVEENKNLKAIHDNLSTHLSLYLFIDLECKNSKAPPQSSN